MAHNTGNPIGSTDPRDLYDNAQNLDKAMNSTDPTWIDRLGVARPTFKGAESELNQKVGDAESAATQALGYLNTMRATSYGPLAADPTTDPLGNPCTAGDEYFNTTYNLLKRFDGSIWRVPDINTDNLASGAGSSMVGYGGQTVESALNERMPEIGTYALLRAYNGPATSFLVRGVENTFDGGAGVFRVKSGDTTSAENGGTILVDAIGRRWFREFSGAVNVRWFGAVGDGVADDTAAIQAALDFARYNQKTLFFPNGTYLISGSLTANYTLSTLGFHLKGEGQENSIIKCADGMVGWALDGGGGTATADSLRRGFIEDIGILGNATADGGIRLRWAYIWDFNRVYVSGFTKSGATGTLLENCFNIGLYTFQCNSMANGIGCKISSTLPGQNITQIDVRNSLFQYNDKGMLLEFLTACDGLVIDNNAFGRNTTCGLEISNGTLYGFEVVNNHFEYNPIHIKLTDTVRNGRITTNFFWGDSAGAGGAYKGIVATGGNIDNIHFDNTFNGLGTWHKAYELSGVTNCTKGADVKFSTPVSVASTCNGGVSIIGASRVVDRTSNYQITWEDDKKSFTNVGADTGAVVTFYLPQLSTVPFGFEFTIIQYFTASGVYVTPYGYVSGSAGELINSGIGSFVAGNRLYTGTSTLCHATFRKLRSDRWEVLFHRGPWTVVV